MSKQERETTEYQDICDWCDEEITYYDKNAGADEHNWAHIVRGYISRPTNDPSVNKFRFVWKRKYPDKDVTYDFHTVCFDEMVKQMLAVKAASTKESQ